jgi:hypothetical protein
VNKHQNPYIHRKNKPSTVGNTELNCDYQTQVGKNEECGPTDDNRTSLMENETLRRPADSKGIGELNLVNNAKRTQTSLNSRADQKSALSANLLFKSKAGASVKYQQPSQTRNTKQSQLAISNLKSINSSTSVKSNKVHPLLTDRSEQAGLGRKQGRLQALLLEKKQTGDPSLQMSGALSDRRQPLLSERDSRAGKKKPSRSSHSNKEALSAFRGRGKFTNQYLANDDPLSNLSLDQHNNSKRDDSR